MACLMLRSRLSTACDPTLDADAQAEGVSTLKEVLTPETVAPFTGDPGIELRPYVVEVHKELRLLQIDMARWMAARQRETKRSRLQDIQKRSDRLLTYLNTLLEADRVHEG